MDQAHRSDHWRHKHSTQNCVSCLAKKVLQWYVRYTIRSSSEWTFVLVPTPVRPVQCLPYYCLTSICMFTIFPPWYWSVYPLQHILFIRMFITNALGYLSLQQPTYLTYLNSTFYKFLFMLCTLHVWFMFHPPHSFSWVTSVLLPPAK